MSILVLASNSPRRKEILAMAGYDFIVHVSDADENVHGLKPYELVETLSKRKAEAVAGSYEDAVILGSDTVVSLDELILGKPKNREEAFSMIRSISGKKHTVYTGVTILRCHNGERIAETFHSKADVYAREMTDEMINEYISTDEPYDKAGGYAIQGIFAKYIERIDGDYYAVVGFPICEVAKRLENIYR